MGGGGFEPPKSETSDLQSAIPPYFIHLLPIYAHFIHKIKNLTVLSLGEEIVMPMYSIGDGYAVRVTQAGKEYTVYRYTQILSGEYVLLDVFNLYKK